MTLEGVGHQGGSSKKSAEAPPKHFILSEGRFIDIVEVQRKTWRPSREGAFTSAVSPPSLGHPRGDVSDL